MNALQQIRTLFAKIDALSLRERAILLAGALAVIYFAWDLLLIRPLDDARQRIQSQMLTNDAEFVSLGEELDSLDPARGDARIRTKQQQLDELRKRATGLEGELAGTVTHLVPPAEMAKLLELVLQRTQGLELRKVTGLGSSTVEFGPGGMVAGGKPSGAIAGASLFRHGLSIEFAGDFNSTLSYLQQLEGLQWKFFWDSIEFKVAQYPSSVTTVSLFTLSLHDRWIGD